LKSSVSNNFESILPPPQAAAPTAAAASTLTSSHLLYRSNSFDGIIDDISSPLSLINNQSHHNYQFNKRQLQIRNEINNKKSSSLKANYGLFTEFSKFLKNKNRFKIKNSNSTDNADNPNRRNVDKIINNCSSTRASIFNRIVNGGDTALPSPPPLPQLPLQSSTQTSQINNIEQENRTKKDLIFFKRFKSRYDIVQFWKKIISEQILLNKMERENKQLKMKSKASNQQNNPTNNPINNENFNYIEITPCLKEVSKEWDSLLVSNDLKDFEKIRQTVYKGVPQHKRSTIWFWLAGQYKKRVSIEQMKPPYTPIDSSHLRTDSSYEQLLKQTTIHQHTILLDLGRTFPMHNNFMKRFGAGQLALFNVLKAYSIFDMEVGYCQGLSFIVGILLIHVNNDEEKVRICFFFLLF
jgi:hypothetical protein